MLNLNIVISVREGGYTQPRRILQRFGAVHATDFFDVLVMTVADSHRLLEDLRERVDEDSAIQAIIDRIMPAVRCFDFQSHDDFEAKTREAAPTWVTDLACKSFHVRLHRRGLKDQLPSSEEEQFPEHALLEALERVGTPAGSPSRTRSQSWPSRPSNTGPAWRCGRATNSNATRFWAWTEDHSGGRGGTCRTHGAFGWRTSSDPIYPISSVVSQSGRHHV